MQMEVIDRKAGSMWSGTTKTGSGLISTESQTLFEEPYSCQTRFDGDDITSTNPEELIAAAHAHIRADVPDIDKATFDQLVKEADKNCPVSNLLRPGLKIEIDATLL
jgi:osmotically inducible protein OsmC